MGTRLYDSPGEGYIYAGTCDLKCQMDSKYYLVDFKTGKTPKPKRGYPEWAMQTAAYRATDPDMEGNGVVHLSKETGEMKWYDLSDTYENDLEGFLYLLQFWYNRRPKHPPDKLPSVTTVLGLLDKPALLYWSAGCVADYIDENLKELFTEHEGRGFVDMPEIWAIIEQSRKSWRKVSKKAMAIGTLTHEAIELYLKDGIEPPKNSPDEVQTAFIAFLDWMDVHEVEPIKTEQVVYGKGD